MPKKGPESGGRPPGTEPPDELHQEPSPEETDVAADVTPADPRLRRTSVLPVGELDLGHAGLPEVVANERAKPAKKKPRLPPSTPDFAAAAMRVGKPDEELEQVEAFTGVEISAADAAEISGRLPPPDTRPTPRDIPVIIRGTPLGEAEEPPTQPDPTTHELPHHKVQELIRLAKDLLAYLATDADKDALKAHVRGIVTGAVQEDLDVAIAALKADLQAHLDKEDVVDLDDREAGELQQAVREEAQARERVLPAPPPLPRQSSRRRSEPGGVEVVGAPKDLPRTGPTITRKPSRVAPAPQPSEIVPPPPPEQTPTPPPEPEPKKPSPKKRWGIRWPWEEGKKDK